MPRRFVFVDRDGTLVEDRGYTHALADYARLPGADEGLRLLQTAGFAIAVVAQLSSRGLRTPGIDLRASWVIGDSPSDIELAARAGCRGVLVLTGKDAERRGEIPSETPVAKDLMDAARHVLRAEGRSADAP